MVTHLSQARRAVIYARVSTSSQTVENQIAELREVAMRNGWRVALELTDSGISGSKGRDQRPAFNDLIHRATRREFDVVMVWAIDRLGRSIQQLVEFMNELQWLGIDLYSHQQALNTATPAGRMVFSIFSALGEYERELIRERIIAGQRRARSQGIKIGRPSRLNDAVRTSVQLLRDKGMSIREIAKRLEIGVGTVYSILNRPDHVSETEKTERVEERRRGSGSRGPLRPGEIVDQGSDQGSLKSPS